MGSASRAGRDGWGLGGPRTSKGKHPPILLSHLDKPGPAAKVSISMDSQLRDLGRAAAPSQPPFPSLCPEGVGAGDFSISSRSNGRFTACGSKAGAGTPAAPMPPGSSLGMQAPRPSPGLLHPNLPFNKIPRGSTGTLKCAKSFQWLHSLGDFRDECVQGLSQRECFTTLSGLRKLL